MTTVQRRPAPTACAIAAPSTASIPPSCAAQPCTSPTARSVVWGGVRRGAGSQSERNAYRMPSPTRRAARAVSGLCSAWSTGEPRKPPSGRCPASWPGCFGMPVGSRAPPDLLVRSGQPARPASSARVRSCIRVREHPRAALSPVASARHSQGRPSLEEAPTRGARVISRFGRLTTSAITL